jgi:hypothetical protein
MTKKVCPICKSEVKQFMRKSLDYWACKNPECKNSRDKHGFILGENLVEVE